MPWSFGETKRSREDTITVTKTKTKVRYEITSATDMTPSCVN